eukprot:CAMPEP_0180641660 /NCGR_PEP_ID=MMETSP1037_2-20121125/46639_1 /TAXON_ID=632150 /ORGANISM="Azadinium spinosum, Strain 3D9" /LENGTH=31 /DNA_ID= /DNA_START= /DNA_END= /DNA_ORIENTATION=
MIPRLRCDRQGTVGTRVPTADGLHMQGTAGK